MQHSAALLSFMITCTAHYCLRCLNLNLQCNICSVHRLGEQQDEGWDPPRCSNTSLLGSTLFSWCNMLGSWQSSRTSAAPKEETQPKPPCFVTRILIMRNLFVRTCFLTSRRPSSLSSVCLRVCAAQNNEFLILLSCVCCRTSLIWILSKSPIPPLFFWLAFL